MSIEKLTSTIIESAENKAKEITEKYEQEIQKLIDSNDVQIKQLTQESNDKITQQQTLLETQLISNAELKAQQEILKAKWTIVDEIFKKAHDKFVTSDTYFNLLKEIANKNVGDNSEIIVAKKDLDKLQKHIPTVKFTSADNLNSGIIIKKYRDRKSVV